MNARSLWGVLQDVNCWTVVESKAGHSTIVNNHEHADGTLQQMVLVMGGKDIVSFIALAGGDESQLSSLDMEAGETITTPSEFNVVTVRA